MWNQNQLREETRRHFFGRAATSTGALGLGSMALQTLMGQDSGDRFDANPLAPKASHFSPKAKNVIFLFMAGGPSQLEMFEHKPKLAERNGKPIPDSFIDGKRFAFMDSSRLSAGGPTRQTCMRMRTDLPRTP